MIIQGATLTGVTVTDASPTTANLVLYYNPANTASYSGSGTTINSLAPTNLTGTMTSITYTNPYFSYNGSSSKVAVADNSKQHKLYLWIKYLVSSGLCLEHKSYKESSDIHQWFKYRNCNTYIY